MSARIVNNLYYYFLFVLMLALVVVFAQNLSADKRVVAQAGAGEQCVQGLCFSGIKAVEIGTDYAIVEWYVDPPSPGQIEYGTSKKGARSPGGKHGQLTTLETEPLGYHRQRMTGLVPDTKYYFHVVGWAP